MPYLFPRWYLNFFFVFCKISQTGSYQTLQDLDLKISVPETSNSNKGTIKQVLSWDISSLESLPWAEKEKNKTKIMLASTHLFKAGRLSVCLTTSLESSSFLLHSKSVFHSKSVLQSPFPNLFFEISPVQLLSSIYAKCWTHCCPLAGLFIACNHIWKVKLAGRSCNVFCILWYFVAI